MSEKDTPVRRAPFPSAPGALTSPIFPSVVYAAESVAEMDARYERDDAQFIYAREGHPNAALLATKIDRLEGAPEARGGVVTCSGMAAISLALLALLKKGDHVLMADQLYGRCIRLAERELPQWGFAVDLADPTDAASFRASVRAETRLILVEAISNPTIRVADLEGLRELANACGALLVVDNTFSTPRALRPLAFGADLVIHSLTKILSGHSDVTLGYVAAKDMALNAEIDGVAQTLGLTPSPFDCWLAERGLMSFDLRYDRAEANAYAIAERLEGLDGVEKVYYPALASHPEHKRATRLFGTRAGAMLSFDLKGGRDAVERFLAATPGIPFAPTLGDVQTTISHPASTSHRELREEQRLAQGVSQGFLRLSVGVEPADLLIEEIKAGVDAARG